MPGEAHARQHIGGEQALPILVGNLERVLDFENTDIVDQNVDIARGLDDGGDALRSRGVAGCRDQPGFGLPLMDLRNRALDVGRLAAVDDDFGAVLREPFGDCASDPLGGAGDEGAKSRKDRSA